MEELFEVVLDKRVSLKYPQMKWWVMEPHPMGDEPEPPKKKDSKTVDDYYDALGEYYQELVKWERQYVGLKKYHVRTILNEHNFLVNPEVLNFYSPGTSFKYKARVVDKNKVEIVYLPKGKK